MKYDRTHSLEKCQFLDCCYLRIIFLYFTQNIWRILRKHTSGYYSTHLFPFICFFFFVPFRTPFSIGLGSSSDHPRLLILLSTLNPLAFQVFPIFFCSLWGYIYLWSYLTQKWHNFLISEKGRLLDGNASTLPSAQR